MALRLVNFLALKNLKKFGHPRKVATCLVYEVSLEK